MSGVEENEMSMSSWDTLAREAARGDGDSAELSSLRQLLTFTVAGTPYAVPVESVREIVRIRPITPVPRTRPDVRGVISLRGEIIQVVDLRLRLGLPAAEITRASRIVVIHADDERVAGILVDAVNEVLRVTEDAILPPASGETSTVESLCVRGDQFVSMIDLERALDIDAEP
ncbi:MAG TPA: chemotaxis protein CheW [Myxococcota bacterium]